MAITSFKTNQEIEGLTGIPFIIQEGATLRHYREIFAKTDFLIYFKNSVVVTIPVVFLSMVISVLACLPPVLLYVFLMDYYISGLTAGSTKG